MNFQCFKKPKKKKKKEKEKWGKVLENVKHLPVVENFKFRHPTVHETTAVAKIDN